MSKPPTDSPPQTAVDALVAELQADGTAVEQGEFTLERGRAREKMRKFQLAEPRHYVLPLVQAAVLKGASYIDFRMDSNDMWMRFDGRPFTRGDFDTLYNALLRNAQDADLKALQELALGANAALALKPRFLRVTSGNDAEAFRLELRPDQEDQIQKSPPPSAPPSDRTAPSGNELSTTTELHVRDKFGLGVIGRAVKDLTTELPEESALTTRCMFAPIPIHLDGKRISEGLAQPATVTSREISGDGVTGLAGLLPTTVDTSWVRLVTHGVLVARHPLEEAPPGCVAIIAGDRLRKNVSQSDIVQDDAYRDALAAVYRAWAEMLLLYGRLSERGDHDWALPHLMSAYDARRSLADYRNPRDGLGKCLAALPVWPTSARLPKRTAFSKSTPNRQDLLCINSAGPSEAVYAGGRRGTVLRLDTEREVWESERLPSTSSVRALWAEDLGSVFALGDKGIPYRRTTGGWQAMPVVTARGAPDNLTPQLRAATGSSANRCFTVGREGRLLRRSGRQWRVMETPTNKTLNGVCAHATSDLFVVGNDGTILRLDGGGRWRTIEPVTSAHLRAVSGSSFDDIVAVGDGGTIVQFDGSKWRLSTSSTDKDLHGVWVSEYGEGWAVGASGTLLRRVDGAWRLVEAPVHQDLYAVYGNAQDGFYAVGANGTILHRSPRRERGPREWKPEVRPVLGTTMSIEELADTESRGATLFLSGDDAYSEAENSIRLDLDGDAERALFSELFGLDG